MVSTVSDDSQERTLERLKTAPTSTLPEHVEVHVRPERRRRWTAEQKAEIVSEMLEPGAVAKRVAERHGISTGLLFTWRRQLRAASIPMSPGFMPVQIAGVAPALPATAARAIEAGVVEIELPSGTRVRAGAGTDPRLVRAVLSVLDHH
jgi:transposase